MSEKNIGMAFDDYLKAEGVYDEVNQAAIKRTVNAKVHAVLTELAEEVENRLRAWQGALGQFSNHPSAVRADAYKECLAIINKKLEDAK